MTSIRVKLTLGAALLLAGGIGILLAANAFFLEPYYASQTRGAFEGILEAMVSAPRDPASRTRAAKGLASGNGYKIVVIDREGLVRVSSAPEFQEGQSFPLPKDQLEFFLDRRERLARGESFFGILDASPRGQSVIQLVAGMGGGDFLVITQPLEQLRRNAAVASRFFLFVGGLLLVFEFAVVLMLSGRLARPILDLSEVARRVAAEDFGARYLKKRNDELGVLGDSLNAMAAALARNIEDLTAANRELALKVKAQETFIAGASHELKTPVGLVRGYAEAVKLGMYSSEAERNELLDVILKEADHLDRLVRDLAQVATLAEADRSLSLSEGDLFGTVSDAVARFALEAKEKRIALRVEGHGPIAARFDPDRIVQVMDNLLSNAMRHTGEGGAVTVRVEATAEGARVEVENTGDPVPEEHLPNLFAPFYRVDASRTRGSGGSGLGLATVKGVAEAHGGSCGARNTPTGFLVWVSLPRTGSPARPS